jgi:transposase
LRVRGDMRLWHKPVYLELRKRRFRCRVCGRVFSEPDPLCGMGRRTSECFRSYLGKEALEQTVRQVAKKEGEGETLVRGCVTEEAWRLVGAVTSPEAPEVLGLGEFSVRRGQMYDTAMVDLEGKAVIGLVSGHRQREVVDFMSSLSNADRSRVVVMEMHKPVRQAVVLCLPRAKPVVDKLHVLAHVHRALDQVRTNVEPREGKRGELYRARYLLLKAR